MNESIGFIEQYFLNPIAEHSGYNIVNTLVYAVIAIAAAYILFRVFKKRFTKEFIIHTIPFVLLGSTARVLTDAIDGGVAQQYRDSLFGILGRVIDSGLYSYGPLTVTPGIYMVTAAVTIIALAISIVLKRPKLYPAIGILLWLPHIILLLPMMSQWIYGLAIIAITAILFLVSAVILDRYKMEGTQSHLAVLAHTLDGSASFIAIEIFNRTSSLCLEKGQCYFGQHVVERFFGESFVYGTAVYLAVKMLFAIFASWVIERESSNEHEKNFIFLLIIIFGLAPGVRNLLRILLGA